MKFKSGDLLVQISTNGLVSLIVLGERISDIKILALRFNYYKDSKNKYVRMNYEAYDEKLEDAKIQEVSAVIREEYSRLFNIIFESIEKDINGL